MSIKEIIQIDNIKTNVGLLYDSIDYINDYGYVGLHDDNLSEESLKLKAVEINKLLEQVNVIFEEIDDIIRDQFEY